MQIILEDLLTDILINLFMFYYKSQVHGSTHRVSSTQSVERCSTVRINR